ncbi:MAG: hypothetical protein AVDCRST_MAG89-4074, partial [uncultured Gemmatimonadetes bacterium]
AAGPFAPGLHRKLDAPPRGPRRVHGCVRAVRGRVPAQRLGRGRRRARARAGTPSRLPGAARPRDPRREQSPRPLLALDKAPRRAL